MKIEIISFQAKFIIDGWGFSFENAHRWVSLDLTDDYLT